MKPITHAYCVELERIVTIDEARFEYLSLPLPRPPKFNYLCTNPACQQQKVRVTGVNDHKPIEDDNTYRTPHFRRLKPHAPGCPWDNLAEELTQQPNETNDDFQKRLARSKLTDFIDVFIPPSSKEVNSQPSSGSDITSKGSNHYTKRPLGTPQKSSQPGLRSTTVLDRLVSTFIESQKLPWADRKRLMLRVEGLGTLPLVNYFTPLKRYVPSVHNRVIYGGAKLEARYGQGARFRFYDKATLPNDSGEGEKKAVTLYISPEAMKACRHRHYINEILSQKSEPTYYQIYAIGRIQLDPRYHTASLEVDDLRHLSIRRKHAKKGDSTST